MGNAMDCAQKRPHSASTDATPPQGKYSVQIAASVLFGIPPFANAYHTSIVVQGEEYFFSDSGICYDDKLISHSGNTPEIIEVGRTDHSGTELWWALQSHFRPGTYDLLRKNCNSFSDAALFFLTRARLETKYSALERMGTTSPALVGTVTNGMYVPNPIAENFNIEDVIEAVTKLGTGKRVTGPPGSPSKPRRMTLSIGAEVTLVGLKKAAELNGEAATIMRYNVLTGRWEATVKRTGETKAFRAENLRPLGEVLFSAGDDVVVMGLQSETGRLLNGQDGKVVSYLHDGARYEVMLTHNGETKALKSENLRLACESGETEC